MKSLEGFRTGFGRVARLAPTAITLLLTTLTQAQVGHPEVGPPPPSLPLTGTTALGATQHILVGQLITAAVVSGVLPVNPPPGGWANNTFEWTISGGAYFGAYNPSTAVATYTPFVPENQNTQSISFYFAQTGIFTIQCVVNPPAPAQQFTVSAKVIVDGPTYTSLGDDIGLGTFYSSPPNMTPNPSPTCAVLPDPTANPAGYALWGASLLFQGVTWNCGILWVNIVTTPTTPAYGSGGLWNYTQLVYTPNLVLTDPSNNTYKAYWFTDPVTGAPIWPSPVLDAYYPSLPGQGLQYPASGFNEIFFDAPGVGFKYTSIVNWTDSAGFRTYILYTPPVAASPPPPPPGGGQPSVVPVPIEEMDWNWTNVASLDSGSGLWVLSTIAEIYQFLAYPLWFPQWAQCMPLGGNYSLNPPYTGK